ncbi:MAG: hypothetical protein JWN27_1756 [Candidatus Eremiobacteraeota bacterium]|nr:hypothetical protein [Candidatus Eremiobacteraeota bacterium]
MQATEHHLQRNVSQETIDRYGRINGDNDIIHYDQDYALKRGFRGTLAHGLMVMGYACELAAQAHGERWFRGGSIHVKWVDPVCPGDVVAVDLDGEGNVRAAVGEELVLVGTARGRA